MRTDTILIRDPDVLFRELDDETVLYHPETGKAAALDPIAAVVWQCLAEPASIDDLVPDFAAEFDAPAEQIRHDLLETLGALLEDGFLGPSPG